MTEITILHDETPEYKIINSGANSLTDIELIAGIISNGQSTAPITKAVALARVVMASVGNQITEVSRLSTGQFEALGLSRAQAVRLTLAFALGRRREVAEAPTRPRIGQSSDVACLISPQLRDLEHEEFWMMMLNRANEVKRVQRISTGGSGGTVVDVSMVLRFAIMENAPAFILAHNHPSGNLQPSQADIQLTQKIKSSADHCGITVLDHIIVSHRGYFSFADEGMI